MLTFFFCSLLGSPLSWDSRHFSVLLDGRYDGEVHKEAMKERKSSSCGPSTKATNPSSSSSSSRGETEAAGVGGVFSVIVSCVNERENISKCIASARGTLTPTKTLTRRRRTRVIVVDGNSTDGTVDEAKKCAAHAKKNDVKVRARRRRTHFGVFTRGYDDAGNVQRRYFRRVA